MCTVYNTAAYQYDLNELDAGSVVVTPVPCKKTHRLYLGAAATAVRATANTVQARTARILTTKAVEGDREVIKAAARGEDCDALAGSVTLARCCTDL